ncbi:MAG: YcgL domain-containing protein [Gammaproteobacteria bacterium]|nr:YcgL domain-containing protein [Gammaproteobacteria bacterium]
MRSVTIYRSSKRDGMYLYVDRDELLSRVPEELLKRFGRPVEVMEMELSSARKLARAEAASVLHQIEISGFYLQMPPSFVCK